MMLSNMRKLLLSALPIAAGLVLALGTASAQGLPAGENVETYEIVCGSCHGADIVVGSTGSRARWEETVEAMIQRGAYGSDEDFEAITNYLSKYFGMPVNVNTATAEELAKEFIIPAEQAEAIVAYRTANGNFSSFDQFLMVEGLDQEDFKLIESRVKF